MLEVILFFFVGFRRVGAVLQGFDTGLQAGRDRT